MSVVFSSSNILSFLSCWFGAMILKDIITGTDLTGLNDTSVCVLKIDDDWGIDTKIEHGGLQGLKRVGRKTNFSLGKTTVPI